MIISVEDGHALIESESIPTSGPAEVSRTSDPNRRVRGTTPQWPSTGDTCGRGDPPERNLWMRVRRTRIKAGEALAGWSPGQGSHRVGGIGRPPPTSAASAGQAGASECESLVGELIWSVV